MPNRTVQVPTAMPADQVWSLIESYSALPMLTPYVKESTLEHGGTIRRISLLGGGEFVEKLAPQDDGSYHYTVESSPFPLPVLNYTATLKIIPDGNISRVMWLGDVESNGVSYQETEKALLSYYKLGFDTMRKMWGFA